MRGDFGREHRLAPASRRAHPVREHARIRTRIGSDGRKARVYDMVATTPQNYDGFATAPSAACKGETS